jgi:hypothetical protein
VVITAKINETGVRNAIANGKGRRKRTIAPNPAPADIPSSPGSARLFLNKDCKIIPAQESDAPTDIALRILGNLMSKIIFLLISFSGEPIFSRTSGGMKLLPDNNEIITDKISTINRISSIKRFFDKSIISLLNFM